MKDWSKLLGYTTENTKSERKPKRKLCPLCRHLYQKKKMKVTSLGYICKECYQRRYGGISRYEQSKLGIRED